MKPNDLLRDLNDPTWREKEQAHYAKLFDAVPTVKQSLQVENDRLRKELAELRDYGRAEYLRGLETAAKYLSAHGIDNAQFFALGVRALKE